MKSPEDIKKTLRCGVNMWNGDCTKCPYLANGCLDGCCMDALIYIQQLEARLAQAEKEREVAIINGYSN